MEVLLILPPISHPLSSNFYCCFTSLNHNYFSFELGWKSGLPALTLDPFGVLLYFWKCKPDDVSLLLKISHWLPNTLRYYLALAVPYKFLKNLALSVQTFLLLLFSFTVFWTYWLSFLKHIKFKDFSTCCFYSWNILLLNLCMTGSFL